jgi:hypothetical protein
MKTQTKSLVRGVHQVSGLPARRILALLKAVRGGCSGPATALAWFVVWPLLIL